MPLKGRLPSKHVAGLVAEPSAHPSFGLCFPLDAAHARLAGSCGVARRAYWLLHPRGAGTAGKQVKDVLFWKPSHIKGAPSHCTAAAAGPRPEVLYKK